MNVLTKDYETSVFATGNFHSKKGKAVCVGLKLNNSETVCKFDSFTKVPEYDLYVAFNAKFELGWDRRLGVPLPKQIHCAQLAEYMLDRQSPYPSLEETAKKYGLSSKLDVVKTEYWDKGLDTTEVPPDVLAEYCVRDVDLTHSIYLCQKKQFEQRPVLYRLFKLACQDLLVLAEMEWNGLPFNETLCKERAEQCIQEKRKIILELEKGLYG